METKIETLLKKLEDIETRISLNEKLLLQVLDSIEAEQLEENESEDTEPEDVFFDKLQVKQHPSIFNDSDLTPELNLAFTLDQPLRWNAK